RLAIVGGTCAQFIEGLGRALRQARGGTRREEGKRALVYSGQGAQWWGMGRQLLAREPAFREAIARCEGPIAAQAGFSLRDELARRQADSRLDGEDIAITQVALFALQVGLTALWRSWGIEPGAVVGHSMGEVAAAHAAAMLTLEEAVQVICTRARLLRQASQSGVMAALDLSFEEAREAIAPHGEEIAIAAANGPQATVISGAPEPVEQVLRRLGGEGHFVRRLSTTGVGGHSAQVEGVGRALESELGALCGRRGNVRLISTVTGQSVAGEALDAVYWRRSLRDPVLFERAVGALIAAGYTTFVEIGAHPLLSPAIGQ